MAISPSPPRQQRSRRRTRRRAKARRQPYPRPSIRVRYSNLQPGQRHIDSCSEACRRERCGCVCHQGYWNAFTRECAGLQYVEDLP